MNKSQQLVRQNAKNIDDRIFTSCMLNLKHDDFHDGDETISLKGRIGAYEINFHGCADNNYRLTVEDFGAMLGGKWVQMVPTDVQMAAMADRLDKEVESAYESKRQAIVRHDHELQQHRDEQKYGRPDTLYSSTY